MRFFFIVVVEKTCAVIEVIEVFKFYKTSITSHTTCYSQIVSSLIRKEKGFLDGFLRTFVNVHECILSKSVGKAYLWQLVDFQYYNFYFLIRFLRKFRISSICFF